MGRRASDFAFEGNSTISSLGNSSVGMQRWKEKFAEYQQRRRQKMSSRRHTSGRRRSSESCCMRCRTFYTMLVGSLFLSVLQGQALTNIIARYIPQDVINFDVIYHRIEEDIGKFVPMQLTQSDSKPLSTIATLKHYEMSRVTALALDDQQPKLRPKSYEFMEHNLVSIKAMAYSGERRKLASITPFFWHIPKAGGTTVHQFVASCLRLRMASNVGTLFGHADDRTLQLIDTPSNLTYVNIDVTTPTGLVRARKMGFVGSAIADIVISPLLNDAVERLFSPKHKAVAFTIMRHPVERSISMFHYLQEAYWEPTYRPEFKNWTLLDYAKRPDMDSDWMVRFLVDKPGNPRQVPLTRLDLERAKIIVRDKIWVGFIDNMQESIEKFGRKFGWSELPQFQPCVQTLGRGGANRNPHAKVSKDSIEWQELMRVHSLDIELYEYARAFWKI